MLQEFGHLPSRCPGLHGPAHASFGETAITHAPTGPRKMFPTAQRNGKRRGHAPDEFDYWLDHKLREIFANELDQPLPPEIKVLLEAQMPSVEGPKVSEA